MPRGVSSTMWYEISDDHRREVASSMEMERTFRAINPHIVWGFVPPLDKVQLKMITGKNITSTNDFFNQVLSITRFF